MAGQPLDDQGTTPFGPFSFSCVRRERTAPRTRLGAPQRSGATSVVRRCLPFLLLQRQFGSASLFLHYKNPVATEQKNGPQRSGAGSQAEK